MCSNSNSNSISNSNSNSINSISINSNSNNSISSSSAAALSTESLWVEVRDGKHNTSFVFIVAQLNHPVHDHSAEGATYRIAIEREAAVFKARLLVMQRIDVMQRDWVRLQRKKIANATGVHHFWSTGTLSLSARALRKTAANLTNMHGFFSSKKQWDSELEQLQDHHQDIILALSNSNDSSSATAADVENLNISSVKEEKGAAFATPSQKAVAAFQQTYVPSTRVDSKLAIPPFS
jgi:hypothetical protein